METKFDPELASEMDWSECILSASLKEPDPEMYRTDDTVWLCVCGATLSVMSGVYLESTAQRFLDLGWCYRRTRDGIFAVCPDCRSSHKK